jgi:hypothetical protein
MVSLLSILSRSMDVSKRANAAMMSKSAAQAALDIMVTDLDSLAVSRNAGEILRVVTNQSVVGSSIKTPFIYCQTTSMQDSYSLNAGGTNPGVPRLVQYSILYTNGYASQGKVYGLYRGVLEPGSTFANVTGCPDLSVAAINNPPSNSLLVPNAVAMSVTLYTNYGAGIWSNAGTAVGSISSTNLPRGVVAEVSVTILDESAMPRFGSGGGAGNNAPQAMIKQFGHTLVRRIPLNSPP